MSVRRQIIAALSEDSYGGIATLTDVERAEQLVNVLVAEVRREDAALLSRHGYELPADLILRRATADAGEEASAQAPTATPDFFQVGRTYTEPGDTTDWRFRCDAITTHPETGERTAIGWRHFHGQWSEYAYGEDDFEIHQIADHIHTTTGDSK
jgi:hypothetical protein